MGSLGAAGPRLGLRYEGGSSLDCAVAQKSQINQFNDCDSREVLGVFCCLVQLVALGDRLFQQAIVAQIHACNRRMCMHSDARAHTHTHPHTQTHSSRPPPPYTHTHTSHSGPHFPPEADCRCQAHLGVPAGLSLGLVPFRRLLTRNPERFVFL